MDLIQYKVTGTVQGVYFREVMQIEANKLGIRGWCQDHPDSSVEGVAAGPPEKIEQFRSFLQKGSPDAKVKKVEMLNRLSGIKDHEITLALGVKGTDYEVRAYQK